MSSITVRQAVFADVDMGNTPGQERYAARGWRRDAQYLMYHRFPGAQGWPALAAAMADDAFQR